jgi:signal transduction histidine kinase
LVGGDGARAAIYTADGRWTTWAVAPVTVGERTAGSILLVRDLSAVQTALAQLRARLWAVGALLALLLIPAGMLVARSLSEPLERLTAAVRRMETGELRQSVMTSGSAETTALGGAFNDMASRVAALDEQRRAFVADAAHELRTPLATLQLLADNLVPDADTEPEHLAAIRRQIARLGRLVDDLLTLARLDNPTLQIRREPLRVANLLDEADWTVGPLAARRGIELRRNCGGFEWVYGDPDWLHHSLVNVLDNALRHASDVGWVAVSTSVAGGMVHIRVEDSGPGVPSDVLPRLGTRFFRASAARDRTSGGSGLGLSIVREVMRLSGGTLSFSCEPGHGLCVDLVLPEAPPQPDFPGL